MPVANFIKNKMCDPCKSCGSTTWLMWRYNATSNIEACSDCGIVKPTYPRDAMGQKVSLPINYHKDYSYAIDGPITGSRQYAEVLKKNNLVQKEV